MKLVNPKSKMIYELKETSTGVLWTHTNINGEVSKWEVSKKASDVEETAIKNMGWKEENSGLIT